MPFDGLRNQVSDLAHRVPKEIRLHLNNGRTFTFHGSPRSFAIAALKQVGERQGPIYRALKQLIYAENDCGISAVLVATFSYVERGEDGELKLITPRRKGE